jgi:hypothetical protein
MYKCKLALVKGNDVKSCFFSAKDYDKYLSNESDFKLVLLKKLKKTDQKKGYNTGEDKDYLVVTSDKEVICYILHIQEARGDGWYPHEDMTAWVKEVLNS